ncbi:CinA family protein [Acinetobacter halotolerans]|uniref:CinA family protein n=1 Tax=Acinetobacter halotolerans TaxID=1752076 RepID=A0A4Q6XD65_9GAMM|nr:CinA family protein [Acinetobacter halotolerans]RZF55874.1 CinA family protein [Acinetobacter halotolerans]
MLKTTCNILAKKKLTIFFFESASAGYLSYQFSLNPLSGNILIGSLVCYDLSVKEDLLKISSKLIQRHTAESMQVTKEMIKKGKKKIKADIYVSCTGLLKKGGSESKEKPVGTFFYCIDYKNKIYSFRTEYKGKPEIKLQNLLIDICKKIEEIIS